MNLKKHITQDGYKRTRILIIILFFYFNLFSQKNIELKQIKNEIRNVTINTEFEIRFLEKIYYSELTTKNKKFPEWFFEKKNK